MTFNGCLPLYPLKYVTFCCGAAREMSLLQAGCWAPVFSLLSPETNSVKVILDKDQGKQQEWLKLEWTGLFSQNLSSPVIRKNRSGQTFFSQGLNLVWKPGSLQLTKVSKCKSSLTNSSAEKRILPCLSLHKIFPCSRSRPLIFRLVLPFYFGLWTISRKSKNMESLLALHPREGFLTSCVWAPHRMEMLVWKKLLLFLSQRMNENGNFALNRVLSNVLPLERSKTNFTA